MMRSASTLMRIKFRSVVFRFFSSWPGLTRPSIAPCASIDGRLKPGHDA